MDSLRKIVTIGELVSMVRTAQADGDTVVLCHGCFDIVHPGHVRHLQHAAKNPARQSHLLGASVVH